MENILVVEDTESLRNVLCSFLRSEGYDVTGAASAEEGLSLFKDHPYSLVLSDLKLPNKSGLDFLKESREINHSVPTIVMTAYGSIDVAVEAMKLGARDFICKPFDPSMLCGLIDRVSKHQRMLDRSTRGNYRTILTQSPLMEEMLAQVRKVAPLGTPVLILGESGVGKELVARYLHQQSSRVENPFIAVNCGTMPEELLESEFFGHESGAFTGALEKRIGLFEVADRGTIFLDEIGNMPHNLQVKLLRTLQESEIKRLGSNKIQKIDTRVISATNCDLTDAVSKGLFREDLYYRLGVFVIEVPPLRDRPEDIELLANYFVKSLAKEASQDPQTITPDAMKLLKSYHWPGNVRELENAIERALVFADGPLSPEYFNLEAESWAVERGEGPKTLPEISAAAQRTAEIEAITEVLERTGGNKSKAARILGVSYKTLLNKIREYELAKPKESALQ